MNNYLALAKPAIAAAVLALCASAHAADISVPYTKAPPAPVYNWSGFYLGGNVGGAFGRERADTPLGTLSTDPSGVIGGAQLGFNLQLAPNWLIGIEGEFDWDSTQGSVVVPNAVAAGTLTSNHDWYATLDGRLGLVEGPWLAYIKGGGAWMNANYTLSGNFTGVTSIASGGGSRAGWTIGAGLEHMFAPGWSAKLEYDYLAFGTQSLTIGGPIVAINAQVHEAKLGVNYHWSP